MSFAIVNSGAAHAIASNASSATTAAINTTGADLIVLIAGAFNSTLATPTDSVGITWTGLTQRNQTAGNPYGTNRVRMWYAYTGSTGWGTSSSHTFTLNNSGNSVISVIAFSGAKTSGDPFDQQNTGFNNESATVQTGSITPSVNACLIVCGETAGAFSNSTQTVDSSITSTDTIANSPLAAAQGWYEQPTAGAINPTWTHSNSGDVFLGAIASFLPSAGGGGPSFIAGQEYPILQAVKRSNYF